MWQEFRHQYDVAVLEDMKQTTAANYSATLLCVRAEDEGAAHSGSKAANLTEFMVAASSTHSGAH